MSGEEELAKKTEGLSVSDGPDGSSGAVDPGSKANAEDLQERDEMLKLLKQPSIAEMAASAVARYKDRMNHQGVVMNADGTVDLDATQAVAAEKAHKFWDTQPVPKLVSEPAAEAAEVNGPLEADKPREAVRQEAYPLPNGFEWCTIDITDEAALKEMYELLCENYVEDDDNMFRFAYGREFLLWALTPPGYYHDWIVGVRFRATGRLMACISGVPASLVIHGVSVRNCEINFLCIHKKLRAKRLAPVLIKEVTRRVNLVGIFQAAYTAGVVLPKPVASCRYWHRSLQPKKLIEVGFSRLAPRMTMARTQKLYALPDSPKIPGLVPMQPRHVASACGLLNAYLRKTTRMHPEYTPEEFGHWLLPRAGVIDTYVVEAPSASDGSSSGAGAEGGSAIVTDMISFYHLPSTVIGNDKHKLLSAVYCYYYVPGAHSLAALMENALILARNGGVDVFNCLDLMENSSVLEKLKFGQGDGNLQYYLYNWQCPALVPKEVGLVLL